MNGLYSKLNAPFKYDAYGINKYDGKPFIKAQSAIERLNEVLGVGYWKYRPLRETIVVEDTGRIDKNKKNIFNLNLLIEFSFYNEEIKEWITFEDAGSQDLNDKMGKSDAINSAITKAIKKCASKIGVGADLYKSLIEVRSKQIILPNEYKEYYSKMGWNGVFKSGHTFTSHTPKKTDIEQSGSHVSDKSETTTISDNQIKRWKALVNGNIAIEQELFKKYNYTSSKQIKKSEYNKICDELLFEIKKKNDKNEENISSTDADIKLTFGIHKGKTVAQVYKENPSYLKKVCENPITNAAIKEAYETLLKAN